jgi:gliding motility-associated-like protein
MKNYSLIVLLFTIFLLFPKVGFSKENGLICPVDVVIQQGDSISFCEGELVTINANDGFVSYVWTGPTTGGTLALNPTLSGEYIVIAVDALGCISSDTIIVTVFANPIPVIVSSEGNILCTSTSGTNLSLTQAYSNYTWSTGSNSATLLVNTPQTYSVLVQDINECIGTSSITISQAIFELIHFDTTVCNGTSVFLYATGGQNYLWSTGETTSSISVSPSSNTNYSVTIVNGSCSQLFSQEIVALTMPESNVQDTFFIGQGERVRLIGPTGYLTYLWTPDVNLTINTDQNPIFTGTENSLYTVYSSHPNGCLRIDYVQIIIVNLTIPSGFSPNGDLHNDNFEIPEIVGFNAEVIIFNRWGDKVFESKQYKNDWDGSCQSEFCAGNGQLPEGTYFYTIDIESIHFDGFTTIKR